MSSIWSPHSLGSFIDLEGKESIRSPPQVASKPPAPGPAPYELDNLQWGARYNGPSTSDNSGPIAGTETQIASNEDDSNRHDDANIHDGVNVVQSFSNPSMNKWRVLSACLVYFGNGLNDSAVGALIPYIEGDYNLGYAIVSLVFVTNAVGFVLAAFFTDVVDSRLGRAKALVYSEVMMLIGLIIISCSPPFAGVVVAFLFIGYGEGTNIALNNVFCANLARSSVILGAAHGSYGIGGICGPLFATALASHGVFWSRFYIIVAGVQVLALFASGWSFWSYENDSLVPLSPVIERTASREAVGEPMAATKIQLLKQALRSKTTVLGGLFIFAYQGAEVSVSGWVISFLIHYRGGDPARVGYVTAGFWGGITLGRFTLVHLAHRFGEKLFVYVCVAAALAFQLLVWLVPNIIGDAVAVSVLGLFLGPVYPCAMTIFTRLLPRQMQTTAVGLVSSAGSSGGAVAPFTTGILAQAVGTFVLHPVCIGLFVVMEVCWFALPKVRKRME